MKLPPNAMQIMGTGLSIAAQIGTAYVAYEETNDTELVLPPIRSYIGADHIEIDITLRRLPPP